MPRQQYGATIKADGTASISVQTRGSQVWRVTQIGIDAPNVSAAAIGRVRINSAPVSPFNAIYDAVGGDPPVDVAPGDNLTIEWSSATVGASCSALVIYELLPPGFM